MAAGLPAPGEIVHLRERDYRYGESDVRVRVLLVGEQFKDADGSPWVLLTGHQVFSNGTDAPNAWTLSARVSGITVVRAPRPAQTT